MQSNTTSSMEERQDEILKYLEAVRYMSESTDSYLFVSDLERDAVYFTNGIHKKYDLPPEDSGFAMREWAKIIYPRDRAAVMEDLGRLRDGLQVSHNMEYRVTTRDGSIVWISCRGKVRFDSDGKPLMMVGRVSDTALGSRTDPLTGLLNGKKFLEDVQNTLDHNQEGCLLIFGLDNFKDINIKHGRLFGNNILTQVAASLEETVDPSFLLYRLDGDRFGLNLIGYGQEEAERIYYQLRALVREYCTLSAGAIFYDSHLIADSDLLFQYAENALDQAKHRGKNMLVFFSSESYEAQRSSIDFQDELRENVRNNCSGFFLCYQPQIDVRTFRICGAEALLRFQSPTLGVVSPTDFIPFLEQSRLICTVGQWVLETALEACRIWRETIPDLYVSVNISYVQLRQPNIAEMVLDALDRVGLPGQALTLEVTESMQLQDYQYYNRIFYKWETAGIRIAIDDFGTGYSSLGYLKGLEINEIKIDRCFVRDIQNSTYNHRLIANTIELARSSQIRVCCEGLETEQEMLTLKELMPDSMQGFLFATPYPQKRFEEIYLHPNTPAFQKRVMREDHLRELSRKVRHSLLSPTSGGKLNSIMDILKATRLGIWVIHVHDNPEENEMFADSTMLEVLGLSGTPTPVECYRHWYSHINEGYYHYVDTFCDSMIHSGRIVQVEYTWNHPELGEVVVRCLGLRTSDTDGKICLEGYHRVISDVDRSKFMQDPSARTIFEYNIRKGSIYFHTGCERLDSTEERMERFPYSWVEKKIVHPDFAEEFIRVFSGRPEQLEPGGFELLLRSAQGVYEWYRLRTRPLGDNVYDRNTVIVLLDPANQERVTELEYMRKNDFYELMLSETVAHAEIDAETGMILSAGGLWKRYEDECRQWGETFQEISGRYLDQTVAPEDVEICYAFCSQDSIRELYNTENHTGRICFRRNINGEMRWVEMVAHVFLERFTKNAYALLYMKDIDAQKKRELAQDFAANTDPLTRVYNRRMFEQELTRFMQRDGEPCGALILFDLDNFKDINDQYGHMAGDAALLRMTEVLQSTFRQRDIIARLGGDEFLAFVKNVTDRSLIDRRIDELYQSLTHSKGIPLSFSAGIVLIQKENFSYEQHLREADLALYHSKQLGKNKVTYYEDM